MQHHRAVTCCSRATVVLEGLLAVGNLMNNDKSNPLESLIKLLRPLQSLTLLIFKFDGKRSNDNTQTAQYHVNVVAGIQLIKTAFANLYCPSLTDRCFGAPERTPYWGTPGREMNRSLLSYIRTRPSFAFPVSISLQNVSDLSCPPQSRCRETQTPLRIRALPRTLV